MISVMSSVGSPTDVNTITMVTRPAWGMPAAPMLAAVAVILRGWWEGWRGERKKMYKGKQTAHEELCNYFSHLWAGDTDKLLSKRIMTTCKNIMHVGALAPLMTRLTRWINWRKVKINISKTAANDCRLHELSLFCVKLCNSLVPILFKQENVGLTHLGSRPLALLNTLIVFPYF